LEFFTVADPGSRWGSDCKSIRILLAERVGFYLPKISQVIDFQQHRLSYA
jgi:hypothetical protein